MTIGRRSGLRGFGDGRPAVRFTSGQGGRLALARFGLDALIAGLEALSERR